MRRLIVVDGLFVLVLGLVVVEGLFVLVLVEGLLVLLGREVLVLGSGESPALLLEVLLLVFVFVASGFDFSKIVVFELTLPDKYEAVAVAVFVQVVILLTFGAVAL